MRDIWRYDFTSSSEEDLRIHVKTERRSFVLPPLLKRSVPPDQIAELELTPPVHNLRKENFAAVKVIRCSYKRSNATFASIHEMQNHEEEMSMNGRGYLWKLLRSKVLNDIHRTPGIFFYI